MGVQELAKEGQKTAKEVIKKATQTVYEENFNMFAEFCITNEYPDPYKERHHELPVVLVAYPQSISATSSVSLQTAEKVRSAVTSYFSSYENSDGTDVNKWGVREDEQVCMRGYGNPARDPFVRQFMCGLKKRKAAEGVTLYQCRPSLSSPGDTIEFGTYTLFNRKTDVAEGRSYNLHNLLSEGDPSNTWLTSHTFRRAGAQYRFVNAKPARRWSLRMIKWWARWNISESTETLVRYLLDITVQSEESELADCLAPDKSYLHGCPSAPYEASKNTEGGPILKRLRQLDMLLLETKSQITELKDLHMGKLQGAECNEFTASVFNTTEAYDECASSVIPTVKDWSQHCLM
ncbi:hypothetical protein ON010_g12157 [Phytophthora cinnamomi]|nr:hypothetical protein ON010_g12157 [Phytophthora cinnamomi]